MVEFATQSGYDRRKGEIDAAQRLAQAARMQEQNFENAQQDRASADALDAAERKYYADKMGGAANPASSLVKVAQQNQPGPSVGPTPSSAYGPSPGVRTAGFNPNAQSPQTQQPAAQTLVATASAPSAVNPSDYFGNVKGGGKILAGIEKFKQQREDDAERNAVTAFRNGDWALFDHFQKTANLKLPAADIERAKTDSRFRVNMGNAALAAEIYKANTKQAGQFFMSYMDAANKNPGGNPQDFVVQAAGRVGPPADKPNWTMKQLANGAMVRINENGDVKPITMDDGTGKTIPVMGSGAKSGKDLLFEVKLKSFKQAFPDASDADALSFANGDTTLGTDPTVRATYFKIAAKLLEDDINSMDMPLAEKQKMLSQMTDDMMGAQGNSTLQEGGPSAPRRSGEDDASPPAQITSQADFDALPSGALYINPADGATYRKN